MVKLVCYTDGTKRDMIIGGPPCQDFSSAGKRNEEGGRGDLTVCYARIISEIKPRWFVMENVERIMKTQKLRDSLAVFRAAGYGLTYMVLNAALCGVPQKRKRFVMVDKMRAEDDFLKETLLANLSDHEMTVAEYFGENWMSNTITVILEAMHVVAFSVLTSRVPPYVESTAPCRRIFASSRRSC